VGLVSVPSFEGMALQAKKDGEAVLCLRDARSEGYFAALFPETWTPGERWIPECVLKKEQVVDTVAEALKSRPGTRLRLCGDGVCMEALGAVASERGWTIDRGHEHISGASLAAAGWRRLVAGQVAKDPAEIHKAAPLYLRASDPELKLKARTTTA
jgi:tRNA A37 threonylcarbamoyladenosine modification protein TsaB